MSVTYPHELYPAHRPSLVAICGGKGKYLDGGVLQHLIFRAEQRATPSAWLSVRTQSLVALFSFAFKRQTIGAALKRIEARGFIASRPDPHQTRRGFPQYRIDFDAINAALRDYEARRDAVMNKDDGRDDGVSLSPREHQEATDTSAASSEGQHRDAKRRDIEPQLSSRGQQESNAIPAMSPRGQHLDTDRLTVLSSRGQQGATDTFGLSSRGQYLDTDRLMVLSPRGHSLVPQGTTRCPLGDNTCPPGDNYLDSLRPGLDHIQINSAHAREEPSPCAPVPTEEHLGGCVGEMQMQRDGEEYAPAPSDAGAQEMPAKSDVTSPFLPSKNRAVAHALRIGAMPSMTSQPALAPSPTGDREPLPALIEPTSDEIAIIAANLRVRTDPWRGLPQSVYAHYLAYLHAREEAADHATFRSRQDRVAFAHLASMCVLPEMTYRVTRTLRTSLGGNSAGYGIRRLMDEAYAGGAKALLANQDDAPLPRSQNEALLRFLAWKRAPHRYDQRYWDVVFDAYYRETTGNAPSHPSPFSPALLGRAYRYGGDPAMELARVGRLGVTFTPEDSVRSQAGIERRHLYRRERDEQERAIVDFGYIPEYACDAAQTIRAEVARGEWRPHRGGRLDWDEPWVTGDDRLFMRSDADVAFLHSDTARLDFDEVRHYRARANLHGIPFAQVAPPYLTSERVAQIEAAHRRIETIDAYREAVDDCERTRLAWQMQDAYPEDAEVAALIAASQSV